MSWWQKRYQQWLSRRLPREPSVTLGRKQLFIFPTQLGLYFIGVSALVLIIGINYQNNLLYGLAFLMLSLLNTAILMTYRNLSGLTIAASKSVSGFADGEVAFELQLTSSQPHYSVSMVFDKSSLATAKPISCVAGKPLLFTLSKRASSRGWHEMPKVYVQTLYPFGLIRCWSWVSIEQGVWIYPKPVPVEPSPSSSGQGNLKSVADHSGEHFAGLRPYQQGDNLSQAHWPSLAKGQPLQVLQTEREQSEQVMLTLEDYPHPDFELRLSWLAYLVQSCHQRGVPYALELSGASLSLGSGDAHRDRALLMLAQEKSA